MVKGLPVHVRDLAFLSIEKLWKLYGVYSVTFDDGKTIDVSSRYIKLSWPYWGLTRIDPEVQITSELCYYNGAIAKDRHHLEFMSKANLLAQEAGMPLEKIRWHLFKDVYSVAYNNTVGNLRSYVTTMDYDDFIAVYKHPSVQEAIAVMEQYPTGKNSDGKDMTDVAFCLIEEAFNDPTFADNEFVQSIMNESLSVNSGLQAFLRGPLSEVNSTIYDFIPAYGFFSGLLSLAAIAKESVATTRSHCFNKDNIADAEYGSRKFQLVGNVIMRHFKDDCGTTHSHKHTFLDTKKDRDRYKSMVGMSYRLDNGKGGEWLFLAKDGFDKLIGKPIEFRTGMTCLRLRDQGLCRVCIGKLYYNMSRKASPGHLAVTSTSSKGSQGILSTKHLDFLRRLEALIVPPVTADFMEAIKHKTIRGVRLLAAPKRIDWNYKNMHLELTQSQMAEISQLSWTKNLSGFDETSLSDVASVTFAKIEDDDAVDFSAHDMRIGTCGNFSKEFIKYCLNNRNRAIAKNKIYWLPLDRWETAKPFMVFSNRSESMAEFVSAMETKIRSVASRDGEERIDRSTSDELVKRGGKQYDLVSFGGDTEESCTMALFDLQHFIARKLKGVPMAHLGIILAASRVQSYTDPYPAVGFSNGRSNDGMRFVDHNALIGLRSAPCMLFFEKQRGYMESLQLYTDRERPESVFDTAFIIPEDYDV